MPQTQDMINATYTISRGAGQPTINNLNLSSMPVQGNYRTNVYGSLLTTQNVFNVEIKPAFVDNYTVVPVSTDTELKAAIESGNSVKLNNDMTITDLNLPVNKPVMIELNNHNLTLNKRTTIAEGQELTIKGNGTERMGIRNTRGLEVKSGSLHVEGVTMEDKFDYAKYPNYHSTMVMVIGENAKVDMKDVTLIPNNINTYAFSTDASSTDQNIHINMENVKILPSVIIACPMLCNLPVTFTAKDCVFEGYNQAFIARGGDYTFTNCTFTQTLAFDAQGNCTTTKDDIKKTFHSWCRDSWGSGTNVPLAAITIGNQGTSYQYPTKVVMKGCTINIPEVAKNTGDVNASLPAVYISANQGAGLGVTFDYDDATTINGEVECVTSNITVNGVAK